MPARRPHLPTCSRTLLLAALIGLAFACGTASGQEVGPDEAISRALALERDGLRDEAEQYLAGLVAGDEALAGNARVLWQLARLTTSGADAYDIAERVIARTRDARLAAAAHLLRGDYLYASGHYARAVEEYEAAAQRAEGEAAADAALKRAGSLLASGDASAAGEAYESILSNRDLGPTRTSLARSGLARTLLVRGEPGQALAGFLEASNVEERSARLAALAGACEAAIAAGADSTAADLLARLADDPTPSYERAWAEDLLESVSARLEAARASGSEPATPAEE